MFELEIQPPLVNIFRANIGHHGWPMKKVLAFLKLDMTLNCFVFIEINTIVFLPATIWICLLF